MLKPELKCENLICEDCSVAAYSTATQYDTCGTILYSTCTSTILRVYHMPLIKSSVLVVLVLLQICLS